MRGVSVTEDNEPELAASHSTEVEIPLFLQDFFMELNPALRASILASARTLGLLANNTEIANDAGVFTIGARRVIPRYFGSRQQMFAEIGVIQESPRDRLIRAAKSLPANASARDISSAAGYKSHRIISLYFNSLEELKRIVGHYECNKDRIHYPGVLFSPQDVSKGVTIPEEITELVAEETGLHVGDGCLRRRDGHPDYSYSIIGDKVEEKEFFDSHVRVLFKKIYNLDLEPQLLAGGKGYGIKFSSKAVYNYKNDVLGLATGDKTSTVEIPRQIMSGEASIKAGFIRGLADADFSYVFSMKHKDRHYYPTVIGSFASKILVQQTCVLLKELGLSPNNMHRTRQGAVSAENCVWVKGTSQLEKWMGIIGSNNPKHITKVEVWKKFGFCPPHTKIAQRKAILAGLINPNSFYNEGFVDA